MMKILKYLGLAFCLSLLILVILGHTDFDNKYNKPSYLKGEFLKIDNNQLRYVQQGDGEDILLVHGTPGTIEDWDSVIDSLATNYRVTAFDRLGHGYSTKYDYKYHLEENANLVKKVIEKLNLEPVMIVGHSYGGSTAAHLCTTHYNDSIKYVILDSPLYEYSPPVSLQMLAFPILGQGVAVLANSTFSSSMIEDGVRESISNLSDVESRKFIDLKKRLWHQPKIIYSKAKESVNYQSDLDLISKDYPFITADVTIVTVQDSLSTRREDCLKFHRDVPNSKLFELEKASHYVQFDQPEKTIQIIKNRLKDPT